MKALVYHGPGQKAWEEAPDATLRADTDAIVRVDAVTICGTDLHILKGDVPAVTDGRILGHEAVGTITEVGAGVKNFKIADRVLVSCITACGAGTQLKLMPDHIGAYTSSCSSNFVNWNSTSPPVGHMWAANYQQPPVNSYSNIPCFPSTIWSGSGERGHQYDQNQSISANGVTLNVDENCLNMRVAPWSHGSGCF
jgi:hypothetical protein